MKDGYLSEAIVKWSYKAKPKSVETGPGCVSSLRSAFKMPATVQKPQQSKIQVREPARKCRFSDSSMRPA